MTLQTDLAAIVGAAHVLTGDATARWSRDWTGAYVGAPLAVVRPGSTAEVSRVMALAHATETPVVPVSGNTGLNGGAYAKDALALSVDRLNRIAQIDVAGRTATVGAGVILSDLHAAAAAHDLIFPLTFGARGSAMVGGVLGTNAGGSNVIRYGNTRDLCLGLEVVLADGRVMNMMSALHKDNSGLNLRHLMIGSEGTLGIITAAVFKLKPRPRAYATATVALRDLPSALALLNTLQDATGGAVEAFEYMPARYIDGHLAVVPGARAPFAQRHEVNVLVELGSVAARDTAPLPDGSIPLVTLLEDLLARMLEEGRVLDATLARTEAQRAEMWARREAAAEIAFHTRPFIDTDIAVPLTAVKTFLNEAARRLAELDPGARDLVVAHLGDGNLHYTVYPTRDSADLRDAVKDMVEDIVQALGGSFSAEHGVGLSKLATMRRRKDPAALDTMRAIKAALDPKNILNPGKTIPA